MVTYREIILGLRSLDIDHSKPVIVHSSLSSFGTVHGGASTVIGAITDVFNKILMPSFTYRTMITPHVGPENNALHYGNYEYLNKSAKIFSLDMPVDKLIGIIPEKFRKLSQTNRTNHPILSFCGINVDEILNSQTIQRPFMPLELLYEHNGLVILLGVNHIANTSIHLAEIKSHRKSFTRWALTKKGVVECPGFPSCSGGFEAAVEVLDTITMHLTIGNAKIRVLPIKQMVDSLTHLIEKNPFALLCEQQSCDRYQAVVRSLSNN